MPRVFELYGSYRLLKNQQIFQHDIKPEDPDYDPNYNPPLALVLEGLYLLYETHVPRGEGPGYSLNEVRVIFPPNWQHPTRDILDEFLNGPRGEITVSGEVTVYVNDKGNMQTVLRVNPGMPVSE